MPALRAAGKLPDAGRLLWHNTRHRKHILVDLSDIIDRVEATTSMLAESEERKARRVVAIARQLAERQSSDGSREGDAALRRELNQHFELLGRRGARALPAAALARALLAQLSGTRRDIDEALNDAHLKLSMFGL